MNHTKDKNKIEFNITKKAKIWLSVILSIIIAGVCTAILINRHFVLEGRKQTSQSQNEQSSNFDDSEDLPNSNLTKALVLLKNAGGPYMAWFGVYLDENDCVSPAAANLTPARFENLEEQATNIYAIMVENGIVSSEDIESNYDLSLAITNFKDTLNAE